MDRQEENSDRISVNVIEVLWFFELIEKIGNKNGLFVKAVTYLAAQFSSPWKNLSFKVS